MRTARVALLVSLMLGAAAAVGAEKPRAGINRFALSARLEAQPAAQPGGQSGTRFTLRANLTALVPSATAEQPRLAILAKLETQASALCVGPGFVFGNGFESL